MSVSRLVEQSCHRQYSGITACPGIGDLQNDVHGKSGECGDEDDLLHSGEGANPEEMRSVLGAAMLTMRERKNRLEVENFSFTSLRDKRCEG